MFTRKYMDGYEGRDMGYKRQRLSDSNPPFFGGTGSNTMYNDSYGYAPQPPPFPVVRLRGLPFDCTEPDILEFFHGLDIVDILFIHKNGRFSGDAFCVLAFPLQVDFALQRNRQNMGRRYVEVFRSARHEYYIAVAQEMSGMKGKSPPPRVMPPKSRPSNDVDDSVEHTGVLRMRGLPFSAGKEDVLDFFKDFQLSEDNIHIILNADGRSAGEAYVEFDSSEDSKSAMVKDRMTLGSRYIELFPSTSNEMDDAILRGR